MLPQAEVRRLASEESYGPVKHSPKIKDSRLDGIVEEIHQPVPHSHLDNNDPVSSSLP